MVVSIYIHGTTNVLRSTFSTKNSCSEKQTSLTEHIEKALRAKTVRVPFCISSRIYSPCMSAFVDFVAYMNRYVTFSLAS